MPCSEASGFLESESVSGDGVVGRHEARHLVVVVTRYIWPAKVSPCEPTGKKAVSTSHLDELFHAVFTA
jgi:hypothetical protein